MADKLGKFHWEVLELPDDEYDLMMAYYHYQEEEAKKQQKKANAKSKKGRSL